MIQITVPSFLELYTYSAIGALLLWTKLNAQNKKIHGFGDVIEKIAPSAPRLQYLMQFSIFVFFGGLIGVLVVGPYTQLQALAGGVAWSRLAAKD